jgi:serine protease Do
MSETPSSKAARKVTPGGLVLLGSVAALGATTFFTAPDFNVASKFPAITQPAQAQAVAMRPASFADIVERVKPAVFAVRVKMEDRAQNNNEFNNDDNPFPPGSPMERFFRRFGFGEGEVPQGQQRRTPRGRQFGMAQGSGFFISADGYAVTNNHVVERGQTVEIKTDDGNSYTAKVVGTDPRTDLALLKVDGRNDFPYVPFSDTAPRIGDWVLAVGNPFGLGGTVTAGIVSASGRDIGAGPYDDFIQIDAPVNRGNSGGPAFDVNGNVIGVNTAIFSPSGGNVGIAFAIPAETVKNVVDQLKERGTVTRGWIGVQIQPVTSDIAESLGLKDATGALVAEPQPDGPATKAGIQAGDVIVSVNGDRVRDARDLARKVSVQVPGETVKIGLKRKGEDKTVTLTLGTLPNERAARADRRDRDRGSQSGTGIPQLGLSLAPAGTVGGAGGEGVVVLNVDPSGPAAERGFKNGDVILDVGGKVVGSPSEVRDAISKARTEGKRQVLVRVKSGEATRFVALPVDRA